MNDSIKIIQECIDEACASANVYVANGGKAPMPIHNALIDNPKHGKVPMETFISMLSAKTTALASVVEASTQIAQVSCKNPDWLDGFATSLLEQGFKVTVF